MTGSDHTLPGSSGGCHTAVAPKDRPPGRPDRRARESPGHDLEGITRTTHLATRRLRAAGAATTVLALATASLSPVTNLAASPPGPVTPPPPTAVAFDGRAEAFELRQELANRADRTHRRPATAAPKVKVKPKSSPQRVRPKVRKSPTVKKKPKRVQAAARPARPRAATPQRVNGSRARTVIRFALAQVGKPYRWASDGPGSYDCSGLVKAAFARVGLHLPHQTGQLVNRGRRVGRAALQPGDIVFPSSGHVGIYLGRGRMVHAPKPGDHVRVSDMYGFWTARRLL